MKTPTGLEWVRQDGILCYLVEDYNIDLLKHGSHESTSESIDIFNRNSFYSAATTLVNWVSDLKNLAGTFAKSNGEIDEHNFRNPKPGVITAWSIV